MTKTKFGIDLILAAAVGIAAFVLMCLWSFVGIHPYAWDDVAVAAGLLPKDGLLPSLGIYLGHILFVVFPYGFALWLDVILAKVAMAVGGALMYGILSGTMDLVSGFGVRDLKRRRIATRVAAGAGAFFFVCSDPVWHAAQAITASTFVIFLMLVVAWLFVRLLKTAKPNFAVSLLAVTGFLAAETPIGWLILGIGVLLTVIFLRDNKSNEWSKFLDPLRMQKVKWMMTFVFIGSFFFGVLMEMGSFVLLDGLHASGAMVGDLPSIYVNACYRTMTESTNIVGFSLFIIAVLVPFGLSLLLLTPATDEDRYLPFKYSLVYLFCGFIAFFNLAQFPFLWYWSVSGVKVSKILILFGSFLQAMTAAWALYVMCVEIFCRDYRHIEIMLYQSLHDEDGEAALRTDRGDVKSVRLTLGRASLLLLPLALVLIVAYGRRLVDDRRIQILMMSFAGETIEEAVGTKYLFTDGSYDSYLRVEAKRRGVEFSPVSLMGGSSHRDAYVRQMGTMGFDDRVTLEAGAAEALRTWVLAKSHRLADISVQLAFEFFRLNRRLTPTVYGLLVRPVNGNAEAAAASVARCHLLADRIVEAHENGTWRHATDAYLKDKLLFAQFRLAVMSRLRAINLDAQKKTKESIEEIAYSDRLNMNNPSLVKILKRLDWVRRQMGDALTPREGLEVALKRADFVMARRYAMPVLKEDPDEPNANFAMGMSYYAEEQYAKAEDYLKRTLKKSKDEPAVYNNLALLYLKTGRIDEAKKYVMQALKLRPDQPEIKDTARQIQKAIDTRK